MCKDIGQSRPGSNQGGRHLAFGGFPPLSKLCRSLVEVAEITEDDSLKIELKDQAKRVQGYLTGLSEIVELKDGNSVYWLERTGKKNQIIHLRSAPLEIAGGLAGTPLFKNVFHRDDERHS